MGREEQSPAPLLVVLFSSKTIPPLLFVNRKRHIWYVLRNKKTSRD